MQEKRYIQSTVRYDAMADSRKKKKKKVNVKLALGKNTKKVNFFFVI